MEFFFFFLLDILAQKDNLHAIHAHWREYKDEYEKLSDWLQQIDISMKAIKNTPLATVLEKTDQVKQIQVKVLRFLLYLYFLSIFLQK